MPTRNDLKYGEISAGNAQIHTYFPPLIDRWSGAAFNLISLINEIEIRGQWNEVDELVKIIRDKLTLELIPKVNMEWLETGKTKFPENHNVTANVPTFRLSTPELIIDESVFVPPNPDALRCNCVLCRESRGELNAR